MASSFFELVSEYLHSFEYDEKTLREMSELLDDEGKSAFSQEIRAISLLDRQA